MSEYLQLALLIGEKSRKIGLAEVVSVFSSCIVPVLFWFQIYLLFKQIFVLSWMVYLLLTISAFMVIFFGIWDVVGMRRYRRRVMKKIERARIVFDDQTEIEDEGNFQWKGDEFGVRYVYYEPLYVLAFYKFRRSKKAWAILLTGLTIFWILASYSIAALFVLGKESILLFLSSGPLEISYLFDFLIPHYLPHLIVFFFCLSLLNRNLWRTKQISGAVFFYHAFSSIFLWSSTPCFNGYQLNSIRWGGVIL